MLGELNSRENEERIRSREESFKKAQERKNKLLQDKMTFFMIEHLKEEEAKKNQDRLQKIKDYQQDKLKEKIKEDSEKFEYRKKQLEQFQAEKEMIDHEFLLQKRALAEEIEKKSIGGSNRNRAHSTLSIQSHISGNTRRYETTPKMPKTTKAQLNHTVELMGSPKQLVESSEHRHNYSMLNGTADNIEQFKYLNPLPPKKTRGPDSIYLNKKIKPRPAGRSTIQHSKGLSRDSSSPSKSNLHHVESLPFSTKKIYPSGDSSLGAASLITDKVPLHGEDDPFQGELFGVRAARHQLDKIFLIHLDQEINVRRKRI